MSKPRPLSSVLDVSQRLVRWPKRAALRQAALNYLATKFEIGHTYTETAVNDILSRWHSFDDYALLRRALIDFGYLARTSDGREYWRLVSL